MATSGTRFFASAVIFSTCHPLKKPWIQKVSALRHCVDYAIVLFSKSDAMEFPLSLCVFFFLLLTSDKITEIMP